MDCETKDCNLEVFKLSAHDTPKTRGEIGVIDYTRENRWKCPAGHISTTEEVIKAPDPLEHPSRDRNLSRYRQKGFTGHRQNKYEYDPPRMPNETNHMAHVARREARTTER